MKIIITEEQKKRLFIPRRQSGEDSKWNQWNKEQPVKDGIRINQYDEDGLKTGIWEDYYSDGNLSRRGLYKDGEKEGIWESYWYNGNIESKGSYKDGKEEGIWEHYYENGNLSYRGSYKNGKEEGIWESYWENGNIDYIGSYKDGKRDGIWEEYHTNGNIKSRGSYKDGKEEGIWEFYDNNGNLYLKSSYKNGYYIKKLPLNDDIIKEVSIGKKDKLGSGLFHDVYPLKYDSNKVIKVPRVNSDYAMAEYRGGGKEAWFNIFNRFPKYFPKVYKVTDKYVILDKLDTIKVKEDLSKMEDDMVMLSPILSDKIEDSNYGVTEVLDGLILNKLTGVDDNIKMINMLLKKSKNKELFKKYIDLLSSIRSSKIRGFIDVNDGNFGYDNSGNLKMLDI